MAKQEKKQKGSEATRVPNKSGYRKAYRAYREHKGRQPTAFMFNLDGDQAAKIRAEIDPLFSTAAPTH